ncbi:MAG: glycogen debranching protein [Parachlamydiaceae bacterium]
MENKNTRDHQDQITLFTGQPSPFGTSEQSEGINFAIAVKNAQQLFLSLFTEDQLDTPFKDIQLDPLVNKTGDVWHIQINGLPPFFVYGYRIFPSPDFAGFTLDPYAKSIATSHLWQNTLQISYRPLGKHVGYSSFDWQEDRHPRHPVKDLIIYEMHVRGFTQHLSSNVKFPGTFLGIIEKIPYLKELGINAVELMPIHEFNEQETMLINPETGKKLCNYWGYSTVNFFSLMNRYASESFENQTLIEFKTMVRELHKNGIEVILDVVYNHTSEGDQFNPTSTFRALNPHGYYMIDAREHYLNFSGCGNTLNTNHPWARELILDSLRYWVSEMHVDGFRFDLASIFNRSENGAPLANAPVIDAISLDPILSDTKMIAEPWDAGGLYQVGGFYPGTRWGEWNGRYRDSVRRFIKGNSGQKTAFATALCGSQDLYGWGKIPSCSINFVTAHDGFTLHDLVSYNEKHNEANGENNQDGFNHNDSWNCGIEGHSTSKKILHLRERQMRNFHLALMISQGVPMILMGDEYAHSKNGNNNTWCHDNELNWFLWDRLPLQESFHRFFRSLIHFRKTHPKLGSPHFLDEQDITWHGLIPFDPNWHHDNHFIAFTLNHNGIPDLYVAFNASDISQALHIPSTQNEREWVWIVNTDNLAPHDFFDEHERVKLASPHYNIPSYSAIMLQSVEAN